MKLLKLCTVAAALSLSASAAGSLTLDNEGVLRVTIDDDFATGANFEGGPSPGTVLVINNATGEETLVRGVKSIIAQITTVQDLGGGSAAFFSLDLEGTIRAVGGPGNDGIAFFSVSTAGIDVRSRSGNDEILYFGSTSSGPVTLRGARGDDEIETRGNVYLPGSSLEIRANSGDDSVLVEIDDLPLAAENVLLNGSAGQDNIGTLEDYAGSINSFESVEFFETLSPFPF